MTLDPPPLRPGQHRACRPAFIGQARAQVSESARPDHAWRLPWNRAAPPSARRLAETNGRLGPVFHSASSATSPR